MKCIKIILSGERVVEEMMEGTKLIKVHFKHVCKWTMKPSVPLTYTKKC
jgi:hypothetical protein